LRSKPRHSPSAGLLGCLIPLAAFSQIQTIEVNRGFVTIIEEVEEEFLSLWVLAGAPISDTPLRRSTPAIEPPAEEPTEVEKKPGTYLGFSSKVRFHQVAGFTSGSLLLGAGVVGTVQWATFISSGIAVNRGFPRRSARLE
jgi:hypothetical protein